MAVATGTTLSGSLAGIVTDIRVKSYKYFAHTGVMRQLVTPVGVGEKGNSVTEPFWDPTARTGIALNEGERISKSSYSSYISTTQSYTADEYGHPTILTYNDIDFARESTRDEQSRMHGIVHAKKIEQRCTAVFASFTTNAITATSTNGLTYADVMRAKAKIKSRAQAFEGPFNLVVNDAIWFYTQKSLTQNVNYGPLGTLGDKILDTYYAGSIGNDVRVFMSNLGIPYEGLTSTQAKAQVCGLFIKDSIGLFMPRDFTLKTQEDIELRGYLLVSTHVAGARRRLEKSGAKITAYGWLS
jgi:hypothetical protein